MYAYECEKKNNIKAEKLERNEKSRSYNFFTMAYEYVLFFHLKNMEL